jgi:hypothetical protein
MHYFQSLYFMPSSVFAGCFTWQGNYKDEVLWWLRIEYEVSFKSSASSSA